MDRPRDCPTKQSKRRTELRKRKTNIICYHLHVDNTTQGYNTKELIYETKADTQTQRAANGYQGAGGVGMGREFGFSRCKLLYTEWINNKVLPHSTGNDIHYPMINQNRKKYIYTSAYIC